MSAIHQIAALMGRKVKATGGTISYTSTHTVHTFTGNGTFTALQDVAINYLMVGGGGGGSAGGGGAGGLLKAESGGVFLAPGGYSIVVGTGGNGATASSSSGSNGGDTTFNGLTAVGGGGGGASGGNGSSGGSGGGGGLSGTGGAGTAGQGYDGSAGAGGGAGAAGTATGGNGVQSSITGTATYYAGGGSPGNPGGITSGGPGGGGSGSLSGSAGTNGLGGGGGGGWPSGGNTGGNGGSGVVIISYPSYYDYSLLLDFANSQTVDPSITFTRASSATRVNSSGTIVTASTDVARIDYDPVTLACKGLLIEEARTNLLTYSEQFDNAAWTNSNATVTANAIAAPDGTVTADKLIEDNTNNVHLIVQQASVTSGTTYSKTLFVKAGERTQIALQAPASLFTSGQVVTFDLVNLSVTTVSGTATGVIKAIGGGWFRITANFPAATTSASGGFQIRVISASNQSYIGDGTSGIYIWGAQLESGAFATSYIPTTSAQVTRASDLPLMTGTNFSNWYRQDQGTFVVVCDTFMPVTAGLAQRMMTVSSNSSNYIESKFRGNGPVGFDSVVSGVTQVSIQTGSWAVNTTYITSTAYADNNYGISISGASAVTDTEATVPAVDRLTIGADYSGINQLNGHIARIAYFPSRLANATLQALSTP